MELTVTKEDIAILTPQDVAKLAERLDNDEYNDPFEALKDWHLLRAIAFHRQELVDPYRYLLDNETYDES